MKMVTEGPRKLMCLGNVCAHFTNNGIGVYIEPVEMGAENDSNENSTKSGYAPVNPRDSGKASIEM